MLIIVVVVCSKSTEVQSVLVEWEGLKGDGKGKGEGKEILYPHFSGQSYATVVQENSIDIDIDYCNALLMMTIMTFS